MTGLTDTGNVQEIYGIVPKRVGHRLLGEGMLNAVLSDATLNAVSEPVSLALLALGLAGIGLARSKPPQAH